MLQDQVNEAKQDDSCLSIATFAQWARWAISTISCDLGTLGIEIGSNRELKKDQYDVQTTL